MSTASLIADIAVYVIATNLELNPWNCLTILASSYVTLAFNVRPFTTVFECSLFAILLMLVIVCHKDELKLAERFLEEKRTQPRPDEAYKESKRINPEARSDGGQKGDEGMTKSSRPNGGHKRGKRRDRSSSEESYSAVLDSQESNKELYSQESKELYLALLKPQNDIAYGFWIGFVTILGSFCNPIFPAHVLMPISFWITGTRTRLDVKGVKEVFTRIASITPGAFASLVICLIADSVYYGTLDATIFTNPDLLVKNIKYDVLQNITIIPLNFAIHNIQDIELSQFYPKLTHFLVNVPVLFLPLLAYFLKDVYSLFKTIQQNSWNDLTLMTSHKLLMLTFLSPIMLLSIIPNQDPRYILPTIIPLILLYSDHIITENDRPKSHWILFNLIGAMTFGEFHQGGLIPSMEYLHGVATRPINNDVPSSIHFVFFHTYTLPRHLLYLENQIMPPDANLTELEHQDILKNQKHLVTIHDLNEAGPPELFRTVDKILSNLTSPTPEPLMKEIYIISPASLDKIFCRLNVEYNFKLTAHFGRHFSPEDPPEWFPSYECEAEPQRSYTLKNFPEKVEAMFSLFVYKVELVKNVESTR